MKKTLIIFLLCIFGFSNGISQGYFPLQKGNQWDFGILDYPKIGFQYQFSIRVLGDTVMPNSKKYAIVKDQNQLTYKRQEGNVLLNYRSDGDVVEHDFSWETGDTVARHYFIDDTIITYVYVEEGEKFGRQLKSWAFTTIALHNIGYEPSWSTITDSLGYTYFGFSPGVYYYCMGIIADGKTYGVVTNIIDDRNNQPTQYQLFQNYPNPFNPTTTISFSLPTKSFVSLKIFDALGRELSTLVNEELSAGNQTRQWNAENVSSGIYFYQLKAGSFTETKKLLLLR